MPVSFSWTISSPAPSAPASATSTPGSDTGADALRDWALDPLDGDLQLGADSDAVYLKGAAGIASDLQSCFRTFLGEWYLDTTLGFPWLQDVLGQRYDAALVRRDVEKLCLSRPGVISLQDYSADFDNELRKLTATFGVLCDTGELIAAELTATPGGN